MSAGPGRRSMRTQTKRPRYPGEHDSHYILSDIPPAHYHDSGINTGNWLTAHHHLQLQPESFLGYQFQHHGHVGSYQSHHQYAHHGHQSHHQHQQYHHHHHDDSHGGSDHPIPGTSRTLRARPSQGGHNRHGHTSSSMAVEKSRKGVSGPIASTSAGHGSATGDGTQAINSGDDADDADEETGTAAKSKNQKMEVVLTVDQMMFNSLFYLLLLQHKKVPVKRSDMIKTAMNSQHRQFSEVMKKLENTLEDVFGMHLICLGKGKDNQPYIVSDPADAAILEEEEEESAAAGKGKGKGKGPIGTSTSYILVSKFPSSVFDSSMFVMARRDPEADSKKTALYLILATIFMLNRPVDEEVIWKIILEMGFCPMVCGKREDLRKFLKSEYVLPCYLNMETIEQPNPNLAKHSSKETTTPKRATDKPTDLTDYTKAKYSWGARSHKEYSKYSILKFVTARFPGRKMYEFTVQYNLVQRQEKDVIDKDIFEQQDTHDEPGSTAGENGSALKIKKNAGGKGETFSIDGENTETETEAGE